LYENTPFHSLNVTHGGRKIHQVTKISIENKQMTLIITEKMKVDEHALMLTKNRLHHMILHSKMV